MSHYLLQVNIFTPEMSGLERDVLLSYGYLYARQVCHVNEVDTTLRRGFALFATKEGDANEPKNLFMRGDGQTIDLAAGRSPV